jgi:hypothetical protein
MRFEVCRVPLVLCRKRQSSGLYLTISFLGKAITAQSSLCSNYCLRVTAEGANQNAQRPVFNNEIIFFNKLF